MDAPVGSFISLSANTAGFFTAIGKINSLFARVSRHTAWVGDRSKCRILWDTTGYSRQGLSKTFSFFLKCWFHQRVRRCPTIPTLGAIKQLQSLKTLESTQPQKRQAKRRCIPQIAKCGIPSTQTCSVWHSHNSLSEFFREQNLLTCVQVRERPGLLFETHH